MNKEKKELKVYVVICQDCGEKFEVEKAYPNGYLCDDCLDIAKGNYDTYEYEYEEV